MGAKDYYQILGVKPDVKPDEIRKAFHRLARQYHPDKNPGNKAAELRFKEISEAHEVLSDPEKRAKYDQLRDLETRGGFSFGGRGGSGGGIDLKDLIGRTGLGEFGGISDLFESLFNRGSTASRETRAATPQRGDDIQYTVTIPFETAITGGKVPIEIPTQTTCDRCKGTGSAPGSSVSQCSGCGGTGQVTFSQGGFALNRACPECFGRGKQFSDPCPICRGDGVLHRPSKVMIKIPRGISDGQVIRLAGQGKPGIARGPAGDLFLKIAVTEHAEFKRKGNDIHARVKVNAFQAIVGTEIQVHTISGDKVAVTIPPGTQPGARLRLKGQGIMGGDHYVEVEITVPQLSPKERDRLRELARESRIPL
ncbi:MAG: J domain-containing protein [Candidatus Riflebacteria bacterium]|nr:J domain-containing protein [Candidatus Riflebacteria bacterium]